MPRQRLTNEVELSPEELGDYLKRKCCSRLHPVRCEKCGSTEGFRRRIFHARGVPPSKWDDEETHDFLCVLFHVKYAIDSVIMRSCNGKYYIDTAACSKCGSTTVAYNDDPAGCAGEDSDDVRKVDKKHDGKAPSLRSQRGGLN